MAREIAMKRPSRMSAIALSLLAWHFPAQSAVRCEGEMTGTVNIQKPVYIHIYDSGIGICAHLDLSSKASPRHRG